jgi:hypothetical protein
MNSRRPEGEDPWTTLSSERAWTLPRRARFIPLVWLLSLLACKTNEGAAPPSADVDAGADPNASADSTAPSAFAIALSTGDLQPAFSADVHDYTVTSLTTLRPVTMTVQGTTKADALGVSFEDGQPHALPQLTLTADGTIPISVERDGVTSTYVIHLRPSDFPAFETKVAGPSTGQIFVAPFLLDKKTRPYLLVLSETGDVLQYTRLPDAGMVTDFKKQTLPNGVVRYTYIYEGDVFVLDENFALLEKHRVLANDQHDAEAIDVHEFVFLGTDHYMLMSLTSEHVSNIPDAVKHVDNALVAGCRIQEVNAGSIVFEWKSTDHPEFYALSTDGNDFTSTTVPADYFHANSLDIDPNTGNIVVSGRHVDSVMELDRSDGSIVWRLGNVDDTFGTDASRKPSHQHFARFLPDGRLRLFDNGNASGVTRILTFGLDSAAKAITSFDSLDTGYYSYAMGSVHVVGTDSLFVGQGAHDPGIPDVVEMNGARTHTFELTFTKDSMWSYRAFKF